MLRDFFKQIEMAWHRSMHAAVEEMAMAVPRHIRPKTLLLIRLDAIGDYVLFHDFLASLRRTGPFRDHRITLCGNKDWQDLTQAFDRSCVDRCFWIDRRAFRKNPLYKLWVLVKIRMQGFEVVIEARHSREFFYGEKIVRAAQGVRVIGSMSDVGNITLEQKRKTDRLYTQLIPCTPGVLFEFYRNREFFENLLGQELLVKKPSLDVTGIVFDKIPVKPYVVIFPGGSGIDKRWPPENFARLIDALLAEMGVQVVLAGSRADRRICQPLKACCRDLDRVVDLSGQTDLPQLAVLLAQADFLVTNETSAVHIAAAVNTPVFCIANGNNFGRFTEYPRDVFPWVCYLYPPVIMGQLANTRVLLEKYAGNAREDITTISVDTAVNNLRVFRQKIEGGKG